MKAISGHDIRPIPHNVDISCAANWRYTAPHRLGRVAHIDNQQSDIPRVPKCIYMG
jgi:hypothetical protein